MADEQAGGGHRVKSVSRQGQERFKTLRALKCFDEIHDRIIGGWTLVDIAKFVQEEKKEAVQIARDSLVLMLKTYRQSIPPGELMARRMPQAISQAAEKVAKGLDELAELEKLYQLQMGRIQIDIVQERNIKKLFGTMTQEIRAAKEILETSAQLKMDLGLSQRHIGTMDVDARVLGDVAEKYGKESVAKVLQDPQARRKVYAIAQKLLGAAVQESGPMDAEADADAEPSFDLGDESEEESE